MPLRLATLAAALVAAAPVFAQTAGSELQGSTTIDAESIEGIGDLEVSARGAAQIRRDELTIFGDYLRYNRELGAAEAEGGVRLQSGVDRFFGPRVQYNTFTDTGVLESPGFLLQRDRIARGSAERADILGKDHYRMINAKFTTCQPGQEDWRIEAAELELDYNEEEGRAKSPRLYFFDVPILAAPSITFPLEDRRKSGFLVPYYAQTNTRGFEFGLPYYWNIAPERDLTITPVTMAKRGWQVKNHFRYLDREYAGEARLELLPSDQARGGESRTGVSLQHAHTLRPGLAAQLDYNRVSDDAYFVDLASQVKQISLVNLPQDAILTHNGAFGSATPYSLQARVSRFQTLQDPLAPILPPYHRLPQLNFSATRHDLAGALDAALPAEYVQFSHPTQIEGARGSLSPTLAAPILAPGWFATPKAGLRAMSYDLATPSLAGTPQATTSPGVAVPWFSFDTGLMFDREARWFGESFTQTMEPRLFYVYAPYRNQDALPVFDTALADLTYAQLFSENRFSGGDRFGDANQVTLALTSRFLNASGQESFRATIGQRYYFEDERVGLTPTSTLRTAEESDLLASVGGRLFQHWLFDVGTRYDREAGRMERFTLSTRYSPEIAKVLNFGYRFDRDTIRQIDVSGQWPIAAGWYGIGRYNYSLLDDELLEGLAGFEHNAGCWVFRAFVQRVQTATTINTTSLVFQLEFNGIGQIGTDEAVQLLKRNVPGYSVSNPADARLSPPSARQRLPFEQVY
jgi:LPS-assembly protein